jgi:hypothetical protein
MERLNGTVHSAQPRMSQQSDKNNTDTITISHTNLDFIGDVTGWAECSISLRPHLGLRTTSPTSLLNCVISSVHRTPSVSAGGDQLIVCCGRDYVRTNCYILIITAVMCPGSAFTSGENCWKRTQMPSNLYGAPAWFADRVVPF